MERTRMKFQSQRFVLPLIVVTALIFFWELVVRLIGGTIFPGPFAVLTGMIELVRRGVLLKYVVASLFRVSAGFLLAVVVGIPLGLLIGWFGRAFQAFNPLIQMLRPISPIAWIPLAILWFGVSDAGPTFLVFQAAFFPLVVATTSGVQMVGREYIRAAQNFGITGFKLFSTVVVPGAL